MEITLHEWTENLLKVFILCTFDDLWVPFLLRWHIAGDYFWFFSFIFLVDFFIYQVDFFSSDSSDSNFFLRYLLGIHIQVLPVHGLYSCCVVSRHISTCFYYKKYLNAPKNQPTKRKENEDEENTKKATWCLLNIFHSLIVVFIFSFINSLKTCERTRNSTIWMHIIKVKPAVACKQHQFVSIWWMMKGSRFI